MPKRMKGKSSSTHGPRTRSVPVPNNQAKSGQSTRTQGAMRIVQQKVGK